MNTIRCPECDEPTPDLANYCPACGTPKTSEEQRSDDQWLAIRQSATWRKEVAPSPNRANPLPLPPRPVRSRPPMWNTWRRIRYRIPPTLIIWVGLLIFLVSSSVFGIVVTRGSGVSKHSNELALQVNPDNAAVGATVLLNGEHFSPYGKIGLTRDASIPIQDTANATIITADHSGNFTDTIVVTPDWDTGLHTINAEDASRHKVASFSIMVTGRATSLRPAHLSVSVDKLDMGTDDQATNTTRIMTLTDIGGGSISWQGNSTQSWLMLSPNSGTFASGQSVQVMVAIDRSKLNPGSYNALINIFSTAGNSTVPVKTTVTALAQGHGPALQVAPSLLSFTASDGGPSPSSQTITVSNPGPHPLQWQATTNTAWLSVSHQSPLVNSRGNLPVTITVNSSLLIPGTYNGTITLSIQGAGLVVGSPQTVFVTVTIMPQCSLLVAPGQLNFASVYPQGSPAAKAISIMTPQGCDVPMNWQATSNASWLTINTTHGQTPAAPKVDIDASGLVPGVHNSSITFSYASGTQTLPVTFTLSWVPVPMVTTATTTISFNGIAGQHSLAMYKITTINSGDVGTLRWTATATGGAWLAVSPSAGILMAHQSASFNIIASMLPTLVPGTYNGTVTISGTDSSGHPALGSPQLIPVSLIIQPACTLQTPSSSAEAFDTTTGSNPDAQTFTISVMGTCTGIIGITPSIVSNAGNAWLSVTTSMATITSGESTTVTVTVTSATLPAAKYEATIRLSGSNDGMAIANSPQVVDVKLNVEVPYEPIIRTPIPTSSPTPIPSPTPAPSPTPIPSPTPALTPTPVATTTT
jgi:Viral BACON domain